MVPKDSVTLNEPPAPAPVSDAARPDAVRPDAARTDAVRGGSAPAGRAPRTVWLGSATRGDAVDAAFLLRKCELRHTRSGVAYLAVDLQDRTGSIGARHWLHESARDGAPLVLERLRSSPYVHVTGTFKRSEAEPGERERPSWDNDLYVELASIVPVTEVDLRDLHEHTPADPHALIAELRRTFESEVEDAWVRRVLLAFLDDAPLVQKLKAAPAASSFHHAYVGGLVEHIASLTRLTLEVCAIYPRLDRSLMLAGAFLHDVGKVDELSWERGLQYTDRGQLLGHIAIGVLMLDEKIRAIPGFPPRLRDLLQHLILSHHGTKEFGSPVLPVTPEALAVHHLDNLDGKLWSAWRAIDDPRGDAAWSPHNRHLGRKMFRGDAHEAP